MDGTSTSGLMVSTDCRWWMTSTLLVLTYEAVRLHAGCCRTNIVWQLSGVGQTSGSSQQREKQCGGAGLGKAVWWRSCVRGLAPLWTAQRFHESEREVP